MKKIYVGYDSKEAIAHHVCVDSLIFRSSEPVAITPLCQNNLKFYQEEHGDASNDFIYLRFLVPYLNGFSGWAVFIDGDMILLNDICDLFDYCDTDKAVHVVKHDYETKAKTKYLGARNMNYPRKNWSSVILWNCSHLKNRNLTPDYVQRATGAHLHRFNWLDDCDIGELPIEWNWLPDEFGNNEKAKLLHWTLGAPCFKDYFKTPMEKCWWDELRRTAYPLQIDKKSDL